MNINELFGLLYDCDAVIVNGINICVPSFRKLTGNPENEFANLSFDDESGQVFRCILTEGCIEKKGIIVYENSLIVMDNEDNRVKLEFLFKKKLK